MRYLTENKLDAVAQIQAKPQIPCQLSIETKPNSCDILTRTGTS